MRQQPVDDLRRSCYHQAGHGVALFLVARTARPVAVPDDGSQADPFGLEGISQQRIQHEISVLLAGPVAESIAFGDYHEAGLLDVLQAATLAARLYDDGVRLAAFGMGVWHRTWRSLSGPPTWRAIRHLAYRLYRERALSAEAVASIIKDARRPTKEGRALAHEIPGQF